MRKTKLEVVGESHWRQDIYPLVSPSAFLFEYLGVLIKCFQYNIIQCISIVSWPSRNSENWNARYVKAGLKGKAFGFKVALARIYLSDYTTSHWDFSWPSKARWLVDQSPHPPALAPGAPRAWASCVEESRAVGPRARPGRVGRPPRPRRRPPRAAGRGRPRRSPGARGRDVTRAVGRSPTAAFRFRRVGRETRGLRRGRLAPEPEPEPPSQSPVPSRTAGRPDGRRRRAAGRPLSRSRRRARAVPPARTQGARMAAELAPLLEAPQSAGDPRGLCRPVPPPRPRTRLAVAVSRPVAAGPPSLPNPPPPGPPVHPPRLPAGFGRGDAGTGRRRPWLPATLREGGASARSPAGPGGEADRAELTDGVREARRPCFPLYRNQASVKLEVRARGIAWKSFHVNGNLP